MSYINLNEYLKKNKEIVTNKNCEEIFEEGFEFCPHCGQKAKDELTIGVLFYNTISNYFSFDARFFKSFLPLLFKPGYLASKFIAGKRLLYLHPAQMYLFISVVFFFMFSFKVREYSASFDKGRQEASLFEESKDSLNSKPIDSATIARISMPLKNTNFVPGLSEQEQKEFDSIITVASSPDYAKNNMPFGYDRKKLDSLIAVNASENEQLRAVGMKEGAGFLNRQFHKQVIKFHKNKTVVYAKVIDQLRMIRDAQIAHKEVTGKYSKSISGLIQFVDTAQLALTNTTTVVEKVNKGTKWQPIMVDIEKRVTDTIGYEPVLTRFKGRNYKEMAKVPGTSKEFDIQTGMVEKIPGLEVEVFFVSANKIDVLKGMDASLVKQELEANTSDEIKGELISIGSLSEVKTGGNWPPSYDKKEDLAKKDD